ncbi:MAG: MFS transporter [Hahellaceae bacterium]|nr:MFS transporter [Hahellaceae bacterium]MCP5169361.1 MFS transporter [Hahellaceae bacterium]
MKHRAVFWRNLVFLLGASLTVMAGATIAPALPKIYQAFAGEPNVELLVRLVLTMPALFIGIVSPLVGYLLDRWGRKPVLACCLLLYGVAGSSGLWLDSLTSILVGRALLGVAVAGIMSGFTALIGDTFEGQALSRFMGLQSAFISFGGVSFLLLGGLLADVGWHWPFLIYLAALPLLPMLLLAVQEPSAESRKGAAGHQVAMDYSRLGVVYVLAFLGMAVFYLIPVHLPFYLHGLTDISSGGVGAVMAYSALVTAITSANFARIQSQLPLRKLYYLLNFTMALGFIGLCLAKSLVWVVCSITLVGLSFGLWIPGMNVWLLSLVPARARGKAVGGFTMCFFMGQFFSPLLSQLVIGPYGIASGYLAAAVLQVMIGLVFFVRGKRLFKE